MNSSSSIDTWLTRAIKQLLEAGIPSARLDAEIILAHTLRKPRTWLHAHGDESLDARVQEIAEARLALRLDRVPIAYIIGHKEFYGRRFHVSSATLIPRSESETMIELLAELPEADRHGRLVDVGTGSGALGITAALEFPSLQVELVDIDNHALSIAKKNAATLAAPVTLSRGDLLSTYPHTAQIILANLPYVDREWKRSPETEHEPAIALFAKQQGLALIYALIDQTDATLAPGGYLFIEADARQHHVITQYAERSGLSLAASRGLIVVYRRPDVV